MIARTIGTLAGVLFVSAIVFAFALFIVLFGGKAVVGITELTRPEQEILVSWVLFFCIVAFIVTLLLAWSERAKRAHEKRVERRKRREALFKDIRRRALQDEDITDDEIDEMLFGDDR